MFMFCIIRITDADTDAVVFEEQLAASPFAMRPLFLVLGKEIRSNLDDIQHAVKERQNNSKFSIIDTSFLNDKLHIISTKKWYLHRIPSEELPLRLVIRTEY